MSRDTGADGTDSTADAKAVETPHSFNTMKFNDLVQALTALSMLLIVRIPTILNEHLKHLIANPLPLQSTEPGTFVTNECDYYVSLLDELLDHNANPDLILQLLHVALPPNAVSLRTYIEKNIAEDDIQTLDNFLALMQKINRAIYKIPLSGNGQAFLSSSSAKATPAVLQSNDALEYEFVEPESGYELIEIPPLVEDPTDEDEYELVAPSL